MKAGYVCYMCGKDVFYQGSAWWDADGWQGGDLNLPLGGTTWHNHVVKPPPRELDELPARPRPTSRG